MKMRGILGHVFEHYDTALFSFLLPVLAPQIFPKEDRLYSLVFSYAFIPLGMIAKPLGALVFGRLGDVHGREKALSVLFWGTSAVCLGVALCPLEGQSSLVITSLFFLARALQNFFVGGEMMGGALFLLDNTAKEKQDIVSGLYSSLAIGGHLLAAFGVFVLTHYQVIAQGWRVLYLLGAAMSFFSSRMKRPVKMHRTASCNLKEVLWSHRKQILCLALCCGFAQGTYSLTFVLLNGLMPLISSLTQEEVLKSHLGLLLFDAGLFPLLGFLAGRFVRREFLMAGAAVFCFLFGSFLLTSLRGASWEWMVFVRMVFVLCGVAFFVSFPVFAKNLVPGPNQNVVLSLSYALGSQLLGSPLAFLSLWCFAKTGSLLLAGTYWTLLAVGTLSSLFVIRRELHV